jgi:hypothetical protein
MKNAILFLLISSMLNAQQSFPGINITPNGGAAGKVQFRTSANVNLGSIQAGTTAQGLLVVPQSGTISMSTDSILPIGDNTFIVGSPSLRYGSMSSVEFIAYSSSVSTTNACWVLTFAIGCGPSAFAPTVTLDRVAGTVTASSLAGTGTRDICATSAGVITVSGCPSAMTNPMTTTGDMIYSSSGSTPARVPIGASGACLMSNGSNPNWVNPCNPEPAWTGYTPTVAINAGTLTTSTLNAAYIQYGKTVKIRIYWEGSVNSGAATQMTFTMPANPLTSVTYQTLALSYFTATQFLAGSDVVVGAGVNIIGVSPNVGGNFPNATTYYVILEGVYESN